MKTKTTKRRKVWVVLGEDGGVVSASKSRADALAKSRDAQADGWNWTAHAFLESRPGDVVLSREDVARLITLVNETARDEGRDSDRESLIVSLLRGGR